MYKLFLARHLNETVQFTTKYNYTGYGDVVTFGDKSLGISSGINMFPSGDIKNIKRLDK